MNLVRTGELTDLAASATTTQRLVKLVDYVGASRALTPRGHFKLVDGKELVELLQTGDRVDPVIANRAFKTRSSERLPVLDYTLRLALAMWLLDIDGSKIAPGTNAALVAGSPLPLLEMAVLASLRFLGPTEHRYRHEVYGFGWYAEELDRWLTPMLVDLADTDEPCPIEHLATQAWASLEIVFDMSHFPQQALRNEPRNVDRSVRQALDLFVDHGVVAIIDEVRTKTEPFGFVERDGGAVELTPLGRWVVDRIG